MRPTWSTRRGPQGRRHVRGGRRRPHQGAVGHGHQPGGLACRAPTRCARRCASLELLVVSENVASQRHRDRARMCACRRRPGARRTARSPTPSGASRASAPSCRRPAKRTAGLVDAGARWRGGWATATPSPIRSAAEIFREHAAPLGLRERRRRAPSIFPVLGGLERREAFDALDAVPMAAAARARRPTDAPVRRRRLLHRRTARPASWRSPRRACRPPSQATGRSCSTPAACATSGTP